MSGTIDEATARKLWELENNVQVMEMDEIFKVDDSKWLELLEKKPWLEDPTYFKHVKMSAVALLKMVMHACAGGSLEIMGIMLGKVQGDTIVVLDSFSLPVVGTETRVNPGEEADGYLVDYKENNAKLGRLEVPCGWYHSHPGYGCWLSGIDVATEDIQQQQGPFIAVVVDPNRTISAGRVEIGAFRTYPKGYKPTVEAGRKYQSIPSAKVEDFGTHADRYYTLDITYFKSSLDSKLLELLWHKYWINTLSSSPLIANKDYNTGQIRDMAEKFEQVDPAYFAERRNASASLSHPDNALSRSAKDSAVIAREHMHCIISMAMKQFLFQHLPSEEKKEEKKPSEMSLVTDTVAVAREIENHQLKKTA